MANFIKGKTEVKMLEKIEKHKLENVAKGIN